MPVLTPREFANRWGTRLVAAPNAGQFPGSAADFLSQAGLPRAFTFAHPEIPLQGSFDRLGKDIEILSNEPFVGPEAPRTWAAFLVIGEHYFDNGSALYCVEKDSGQVFLVDVELDEPFQFLNTSIPAFATCLEATADWTAQWSIHGDWLSAIDSLRTTLTQIDSMAFSARESAPTRLAFWPMLLDEMRRQPPGTVGLLRT